MRLWAAVQSFCRYKRFRNRPDLWRIYGGAGFIGNIFVALWNLVVDVFVMIYNLVATVANFIGNVFNDPVGAVARLFFDLADTVLSVLRLWLRP